MRQLTIASMLATALLASAAAADTITFSTASPGVFAGSAIEGDFRYELFSGGLFIDAANGNPGNEVEGGIAGGGGVLRIVRDDVVGGLFTFDGAHVVQFSFGAVPIVIEGYLGGALQASDSLVTSAANLAHLSLASVNLNGVTIDELRVVLNATSAPFAWEGVDNVGVTVIPEPGTALLLLTGLIALRAGRRRA